MIAASEVRTPCETTLSGAARSWSVRRRISASVASLRRRSPSTGQANQARGGGELDEQLTVIQDEQTQPWGIKVESVQLQDIKVPDSLQDAMSRMAQAERERQARVILGESELSVARMFEQAGQVYDQNPTALHLRGMNMLYETMRNGTGSIIVVPSSALDSMNLGVVGGLSALAKSANGDGQPKPADGNRPTPPPPSSSLSFPPPPPSRM